MTPAEADSAPVQFGLRSLFVATTLVAVLFSLWSLLFRPHVEHNRLRRRVEECIMTLRQKAPPSELTQRQWDFMTGWTWNAVGNCLGHRTLVNDYPRFRRFVEDLEERMEEDDASLVTIDWIWDEIEQISITRYGHWRPTLPENLVQAECFSW